METITTPEGLIEALVTDEFVADFAADAADHGLEVALRALVLACFNFGVQAVVAASRAELARRQAEREGFAALLRREGGDVVA